MSELICPFCGQELDYLAEDIYGNMYCPNCRDKNGFTYKASESIWQELIRTRKALEQSEICCTEWEKQALDYKAENIALSGDLEHTRKALEIAVDALKYLNSEGKRTRILGLISITDTALDKIKTALEQKD